MADPGPQPALHFLKPQSSRVVQSRHFLKPPSHPDHVGARQPCLPRQHPPAEQRHSLVTTLDAELAFMRTQTQALKELPNPFRHEA